MKSFQSFITSRLGLLLCALCMLAVVGVAMTAGYEPAAIGKGVMLAFVGLALGLNTVAYEYPVAGATAPTLAQSSRVNAVSAVITGDGAGTTFTVTHNLNISTADLAKGFPYVDTEVLLAAGNTAAAIVTTKTANTVVFTCTAFTGAGLRVRVQRPNSLVR